MNTVFNLLQQGTLLFSKLKQPPLPTPSSSQLKDMQGFGIPLFLKVTDSWRMIWSNLTFIAQPSSAPAPTVHVCLAQGWTLLISE